MTLSAPARWILRIFSWAVLGFLYLPLALIVILSFNTATSLSWPPDGLWLEWWRRAYDADAPREALWTSVKLALAATAVALVLGTCLSFALHRYKFFGRNSLSFLIVLPIALPGHRHGCGAAQHVHPARDGTSASRRSSSATARSASCWPSTTWSPGCAACRPTCRRPRPTWGRAGWQTFRHVTFPLIRSALLAGGLLAFALSFDEIVVTTFTAGAGIETLPQWILNNFARPNNVPLVTVVATVVMLLSIPLAWLAQRLTGEPPGLTTGH